MYKTDYRLLKEIVNKYSDEAYRIFEKLKKEDLKSKTNIIKFGSYSSFEGVEWEDSDEDNICILYYDYGYGCYDSSTLVIPVSILFDDKKIDKWIQDLITDALKKIEESKQKKELEDRERERLEYERLKAKFEN